MKNQSDLSSELTTIQNTRNNTRLEIRKQKINQYIHEKKLTSYIFESTEISNLKINPKSLTLSSFCLENCDNLFTFKDHLAFIIDSFINKNEANLKYALYLTRVLLCSDCSPKSSLIIEESINEIYEIVKILEFYCQSDRQIAYETLWIFEIILYYLNNDSFSGLIFKERYINSILKFVQSNSNSDEAIIISLMAIGNGLSSSNRGLLLSSNFHSYVTQLVNSSQSIEILINCIWLFRLVIVIKPELTQEVSL